MARKRTQHNSVAANPASILLVGPPSPAMERKQSLLHDSGFDITLAENICYAEMFAESQYFDAAIYDDSLSSHEQVSLARVMRVRWPWMRLISCGQFSSEEVFDARESSESQLPETVRELLS